MRVLVRLGFGFFGVSLVIIGCKAEVASTGGPPITGGGDGGAVVSESGDQCRDGIDNDGDGVSDCLDSTCIGTVICGGNPNPNPNPMPLPSGDGGTSPDGCDAIHVQARTELRPVDIIWVVDTSGSMDDEQRLIQENMNSFVTTIAASGIDYHVVGIGGLGNVPPPLGGSDRFRLVGVGVESEDGLIAAVQNFGRYQDFLRPNAITHTVHVTDDDSHDYNWQTFKSQMEGQLGHSFTAHAIVSPRAARTALALSTKSSFPAAATAPTDKQTAMASNTGQ